MRTFILSIFLLHAIGGEAQELFTMTDPASNVAARSISLRVDNSVMDELNTSKTNYHLIPELATGLSKKWMLRGSAFFSNRSDKFRYEGGSIYSKFRFLSNDAMQQHFRMAAFVNFSYNNSDVHQEEISLYGHNTGFETGLVATKLSGKTAVSTSASFIKAMDNGNNNKFIYGLNNGNAVNYSISIGKLMLPKEYENYRQTNLNLMAEVLSQVNTRTGKYYIDIAPTIQFIFHSQSRIDISYKKQISSSLLRTAPNGFFIRVEHNLFNVF
jgi:hypothetical protein